MRCASTAEQQAPAWERAAGNCLVAAGKQTRLVARATPANLREELAALEHDFQSDRERAPRFFYSPTKDSADSRQRLERLAAQLQGQGPLAGLYAERAHELSLELALSANVGQPSLWQLARTRFAAEPGAGTQADQLCKQWLAEPAAKQTERNIQSDDASDPQSLLRRMRQRVGAARLGLRVLTSSRLAALAATGPGVIYVAEAVLMSRNDVERTVLHEVEGHALPRERAAQAALSIFRVGTARGIDEQEGRAIVLEERGGWLDWGRRRELALRHLACRSVEDRAGFVETVRTLRDQGGPLTDSLRIAARAHRGGGLAREIVYLPAFVRVRDALRRDPSLEEILGCGRVSLPASIVLRTWLQAAGP